MKVTKQQAEIIEKVLNRYNGDKARAAMGYAPCRQLSIELFTRCMIEGWEVERTKEQQIEDLYAQYKGKRGADASLARPLIKRVLDILEIQIEGINK
jgi:hypothetical protein